MVAYGKRFGRLRLLPSIKLNTLLSQAVAAVARMAAAAVAARGDLRQEQL
jgi:hypothetical protein